MAYGDQPALTCELVEWARSCGFEVVAAGKGTKDDAAHIANVERSAPFDAVLLDFLATHATG